MITIHIKVGNNNIIEYFKIIAHQINLWKIPILYEDNQAAIRLANTEDSKTLKHIVKLYYWKWKPRIIMILEWVPTNEQLADFFYKNSGWAKIQLF